MCIRHQAPGKGIEHPEERPDNERERQAELGPDLIDDPAGGDGHAGVKGGECRGQIREIRIGPAEPPLGRGRAEEFLEVTDDLAVHVIEGGGEEEEGADDPAKGRGGGREVEGETVEGWT